MSIKPIGFMSYVPADDTHENGRLSAFCSALSGEVGLHRGEDFPIFQHENNSAWGQQWQQRLDDTLGAVTFLIPIITPRFFGDEACRAELRRFIEREKQLGRSDLVLPVYYFNTPALDDPAKRDADELVQLIHARQHKDWRGLRQEPLESPVMRKMLEEMAAQIVAAMARGNVPVPVTASAPASAPAEPTPATIPPAPARTHKGTKRIAVLTANPIGDKPLHTDLLAEFKKLKCEISHFPLNTRTLNDLNDFDYIFILSTLVKQKIIIEGETLQSASISLTDLEAQIGDRDTLGVFIFLNHNHTDALNAAEIAALTLPTLILPALQKAQMGNIGYKFFKKEDFTAIEQCAFANRARFTLGELKGAPSEVKTHTALPDLIDKKNTEHYVGRRTDLGNICREVIDLQSKNAVLSIKGSGGIGKTITIKKIAVALAERHYFKDGIDFVDCEFIGDHTVFAKKLAACFGLENALDIRAQIKASIIVRQERLIILDNAETLLHLPDQQQIKDFIDFICDYASIVITTREALHLDCEQVYELRPFTSEEAYDLFIQELGNRTPDKADQGFIRQHIVETLLDNNPLAITLVANNLPKAKSFAELQDDLQNDFFRQISDTDMAAFDRVADSNIERKKSLYASINFSYGHLTEAEKIAFELLSLFPDGISIKTLQRIAQRKPDGKTKPHQAGSAGTPPKPLITDGIIKALEDKSITQTDHGVIKLQSIVGKFAGHQWAQRSVEERAGPYRNAISHHLAFAQDLYELLEDDPYRARKTFNDHQDNFFKSIDYIDAIRPDDGQLLGYLEKLTILSTATTASAMLAQVLEGKWPRTFSHDTTSQCCFDVILLNVKYFAGEFDDAFAQLKQRLPRQRVSAAQPQSWVERIMFGCAIPIYGMEGEALLELKYAVQQKQRYRRGYPDLLLRIGVLDRTLLACCKVNFFTLEARHASGILTGAMVDAYIAAIYPKDHIELMQAHYLKAKLGQDASIGKLPDSKRIKQLVSVNPYTLGLQQLMLALGAGDGQAKTALFEQALPNLSHIKYYYVEALLLYARHLQQSGHQQEFAAIHQQGLGLACHHHYRWLRHQFEALTGDSTAPYSLDAYPLPEQIDVDGYVRWLIKENKR